MVKETKSIALLKYGPLTIVAYSYFLVKSAILLWGYKFLSSFRDNMDFHIKKSCQKIMWLLKVKVDLKAESKLNNENNRPVLMMSNHQSNFDPFIPSAVLPFKFCFLAKRELLKIPFAGTLLKLMGSIFIDRQQTNLNKAELDNIFNNERCLWLFPEGTRSRDGHLLPFKYTFFRIALEMDAIIIPVGIKGSRDILPVGKLMVRSGQTISLNMGRQIDTRDFESYQVKQLANFVFEEINRLI